MSGWGGLTLALDAATYQGSVAVLRDGQLVADRVVAMRGETEERLMPAVLAAVAAAGAEVGDIERVICGEGPGSFTSLRIAGSIAKGIAMGNGVPLFGVSSLALIVAEARHLPPGKYLAVLDAMRGDRYVMPAVIDASGAVVLPAHRGESPDETRLASRMVLPADDVARLAAAGPATCIGPLESTPTAPHARGVVALLDAVAAAGPVDLDTWEPIYGRLAEAQVRWEAAHGRPLGA